MNGWSHRAGMCMMKVIWIFTMMIRLMQFIVHLIQHSAHTYTDMRLCMWCERWTVYAYINIFTLKYASKIEYVSVSIRYKRFAWHLRLMMPHALSCDCARAMCLAYIQWRRKRANQTKQNKTTKSSSMVKLNDHIYN